MTLRALELFCGIGGFAAAVAKGDLRVSAALDLDGEALSVYRRNFPEHPVRQTDLERISAWELTVIAADLWWLSPPCQPYCERGVRRDLNDHRARSLVHLMEILEHLPEPRLPRFLALENVAGFVGSQAHARLVALLAGRGFALRERLLCPTEVGIPSRRPRFYLIASREGFLPPPPAAEPPRSLPLASFLNPDARHDPALRVSDEIVARFGIGFRILDPDDPDTYTTCFTSGYGRSLMHAGAYLRCPDGGVRRFAPEEIARLLGFPREFSFPEGLSLRRRWHLVGNSLSVAAVREALRALPGVVGDGDESGAMPASPFVGAGVQSGSSRTLVS